MGDELLEVADFLDEVASQIDPSNLVTRHAWEIGSAALSAGGKKDFLSSIRSKLEDLVHDQDVAEEYLQSVGAIFGEREVSKEDVDRLDQSGRRIVAYLASRNRDARGVAPRNPFPTDQITLQWAQLMQALRFYADEVRRRETQGFGRAEQPLPLQGRREIQGGQGSRGFGLRQDERTFRQQDGVMDGRDFLNRQDSRQNAQQFQVRDSRRDAQQRFQTQDPRRNGQDFATRRAGEGEQDFRAQQGESAGFREQRGAPGVQVRKKKKKKGLKGALSRLLGEMLAAAEDVDVALLESGAVPIFDSIGGGLAVKKDSDADQKSDSDSDSDQESESGQNPDPTEFSLDEDQFTTEQFSDVLKAVRERASSMRNKKQDLLDDYRIAQSHYNYVVEAMNVEAWMEDHPGQEAPAVESELDVPSLAHIDEEQILELLDQSKKLEPYDISAESIMIPYSNAARLCALTGNRAPYESHDILGSANRFECPDSARQYAIENPQHTRYIQALSGAVPLDKVGVWQNPSSCKKPMVLMVVNKQGKVARVTRGNPSKDLVHKVSNSIRRSILPSDARFVSCIPEGPYSISVDVTTAPALLLANKHGSKSRSAAGWKRVNSKKLTKPHVLVSDGVAMGESVILSGKDVQNIPGLFQSEGVARVTIANPLGERDIVEESFYRLRSKEKRRGMHTIEILTNSGGVISLNLVEEHNPKFGRTRSSQEVSYTLDHIEYFFPGPDALLSEQDRARYHLTDVNTACEENKVALPLSSHDLVDLENGYGTERVIYDSDDSDIHSELSAIGEHVFDCAVEKARAVNQDIENGILVDEREQQLADMFPDQDAVEDFCEDADQDPSRLHKYVFVNEQHIEQEQEELDLEDHYIDDMRAIREDLLRVTCQDVDLSIPDTHVAHLQKQEDDLRIQELQCRYGLDELRLNKIERRLDAVHAIGAPVLEDRLQLLHQERVRSLEENAASQEVLAHLSEERMHIAAVQEQIGEQQTGQWQDFIDTMNKLAEKDEKTEQKAQKALSSRGVNITLHADLEDLWDRVQSVVDDMDEERDFVDFEHTFNGGSDHLYSKETIGELHNLKEFADSVYQNAGANGSSEFVNASGAALKRIQSLLLQAEQDDMRLKADLEKRSADGSNTDLDQLAKTISAGARRRRSRRKRSRRSSRGRARSSRRRGRSRSRSRRGSRSRSRSKANSSQKKSNSSSTGAKQARRRRRRNTRGRNSRRRRSSRRRNRRRSARRQARQSDQQGTARKSNQSSSGQQKKSKSSARTRKRRSRPRRQPRKEQQRQEDSIPSKGSSNRRTGFDRIPGVQGFRTRFAQRPSVLNRLAGGRQRGGGGGGGGGEIDSQQQRQRQQSGRPDTFARQEADLERQRGQLGEREFLLRQRDLDQQRLQFSQQNQPQGVLLLQQPQATTLAIVQPSGGVQGARVLAVAPVASRSSRSVIPPRQYEFTENFDQKDSFGRSVINTQRGNVFTSAPETVRRGDLLLVQERKTRADLPITDFGPDGRLRRSDPSFRNITAESPVSDLDTANSRSQEQGPGADDFALDDQEPGFVGDQVEESQHIGKRYGRHRFVRANGTGRKPYTPSSKGGGVSRSHGTYNIYRGPHYNRGTVTDHAQAGRSYHGSYGKHSVRRY